MSCVCKCVNPCAATKRELCVEHGDCACLILAHKHRTTKIKKAQRPNLKRFTVATNLAGNRNRLLPSLGYDFLARRSELVAIRDEGVTFTPDGALKGIIRRSKTDQYGRGRMVFGSERSAKLLKKCLRQKPAKIQPVFCVVNHGGCLDRAICDRQVNEVIKQALVRVERYPRPSDLEVSGQSLKVGAAQDLLVKGHNMAEIMRAVGWSEPSTVVRYLRFAMHNIWQMT